MRSFLQLDRSIGQVPGTIVTALATVDFGRGSEALYRSQLPGLLHELQHRARVASITASCAIDGVVVPNPDRARSILAGVAHHLRNRDEQELAGCRDTLDYLIQTDSAPLNVGLVQHLHQLLFAHTNAVGAQFKAEHQVHELIERYNAARGGHHPIFLIGLFVLDLSIIGPFEDGNGRVCRAITKALLEAQGYTVGRYVSLEQIIADSADDYYEALSGSTYGWHHNQVDPWPWLAYFVGMLAAAYRAFAQRAASDRVQLSKKERVRDYVGRHAPLLFRMADVRASLPGISDQTIRLVLSELKQDGQIAADGVGRNAQWRKRSV